MNALDHFVILVLGDDQLWFLWLRLTQIFLLGNFGQVVFTLVVGSFNFFTLKVT